MEQKILEILESVRDGSTYTEDALKEILLLVPEGVIGGKVSMDRYGLLIKTNIKDTSKMIWMINPSNSLYLGISGICVNNNLDYI
jgi:hypothetical protein